MFSFNKTYCMHHMYKVNMKWNDIGGIHEHLWMEISPNSTISIFEKRTNSYLSSVPISPSGTWIAFIFFELLRNHVQRPPLDDLSQEFHGELRIAKRQGENNDRWECIFNASNFKIWFSMHNESTLLSKDPPIDKIKSMSYNLCGYHAIFSVVFFLNSK